MVGIDGDESPTLTLPSGEVINCSEATGAGYSTDSARTCGCGPHLVYCLPGGSLQDYKAFILGNPQGSRRLAWDEPARLFAHLVWHDRPLACLLIRCARS